MQTSRSVHELSVLLVEPSTMQAKIITSQLKQLGVGNVDVAENAAAALDLMHAHAPHLVVSAMYLQDMTGTELIQTMRMTDDLNEVPFILISSESRPNVLDPVRQSGVCGILPKPFSLAQLQTAIGTTLDWLNSDESLEEAGIELSGRRVLLVDDSPMARKFMRRVLENLGFDNIVEAENGVEAAFILDAEMVDLVVTDYNMPEMDGKALIEHIRTSSWQNSVPVIMVTSETNESRLAAVQDMGVVGVCDKPFEPATVKGLLHHLLAH